jgi:hypothetical protein
LVDTVKRGEMLRQYTVWHAGAGGGAVIPATSDGIMNKDTQAGDVVKPDTIILPRAT